MRPIRSSVAALLSGMLLSLAGCGGGDNATASIPSVQSGPQAKALASADTPATTVVSLAKISETRVSRTIYEYIFKISVKNGALPRSAIMATATATGPGTTIIDGSVLVGDIASGVTITPTDTITLRHDRAFPFDTAALVWKISDPINGLAVPPEPDSVLSDATLPGVDTNRNGVRDDVERKIASSVTQAKDFADALMIAKIHQGVVASPPPDSRSKAIGTMTKIACLAQKSTSVVQLLDFEGMTANTPQRSEALRAFYDVLIAFSARELQSCGA